MSVPLTIKFEEFEECAISSTGELQVCSKSEVVGKRDGTLIPRVLVSASKGAAISEINEDSYLPILVVDREWRPQNNSYHSWLHGTDDLPGSSESMDAVPVTWDEVGYAEEFSTIFQHLLLTFRSSRLIIHRILIQGTENRNTILQLTAIVMTGVCLIEIARGVGDPRLGTVAITVLNIGTWFGLQYPIPSFPALLFKLE